MKRIAVIFILAIALTGCFKKVSFNAQYLLTCWTQAASGGELTKADNIEAFIFNGDTTTWRVASYEDALLGKVTNKSTGEKRDASSKSKPYGQSGNVVEMAASRRRYMVVAVDETAQLFAYREQVTVENLSPLDVKFVFRTWKNVPVYKDDAWVVVNDFVNNSGETE